MNNADMEDIRARILRPCDNCLGDYAGPPFAPYTCPECRDDPGVTSDPGVTVEEVMSLIEEIERLRSFSDSRG